MPALRHERRSLVQLGVKSPPFARMPCVEKAARSSPRAADGRRPPSLLGQREEAKLPTKQ